MAFPTEQLAAAPLDSFSDVALFGWTYGRRYNDDSTS